MRACNVSLIILVMLISISSLLTGCGNNNGVSNIDFTTYTDTHKVFSISYPVDWELVPYIIDEAQEFLEAYSENPDMSIDETQTVFTAGNYYSSEHSKAIIIMLMDCPPFFNSINDNFISLMASGFESSFENYDEISREIIPIDGREAAILEFEADVSGGNTAYIIEMFTINRGQLWSVMCMVNTEKQDEYEEIFNTAVRSLVLLKDSSEPSATPSGTPGTNQSSIESISSSVAEIRGLDPTGAVQYEFISGEEFLTGVNEIYEEEYSEDEEEIDQKIYILLDLMDDSEELRDMLIDVQSEQVIGFYDDEFKIFFIVSDESGLRTIDKITIAHEYTHALQDQHFDLSTLPIRDTNNSDKALAALSLIEGDASLCTFMYAFNELSADDIEELLDEVTGIDSEALDNAPAVISETLMFPYEAGLDFVMEAYDKDEWKTINDAYADPPQSTEQIIHPEKYFSPSDYDEPQTVEIPDIQDAIGTKWKLKYTDVLGELITRLYLDTFISTTSAKNAAAGWDGDLLQYWETTAGEQLLVMYWIWDSEDDAEELYYAYLTFMKNKIDSSWDVVDKDDDFQQWQSKDQSVYLSKNGQNTLIIISTDEDIIEDVVAEF